MYSEYLAQLSTKQDDVDLGLRHRLPKDVENIHVSQIFHVYEKTATKIEAESVWIG